MLMLKLQRVGKKHQASFRLIVGEKREKLDGKQLEDLGWYNPRTKKQAVNKDRVLHWLQVGAGKSPSVHNVLVNAGVLNEKKIAAHKLPKKAAVATAPKAEIKAGEKKVEEVPDLSAKA